MDKKTWKKPVFLETFSGQWQLKHFLFAGRGFLARTSFQVPQGKLEVTRFFRDVELPHPGRRKGWRSELRKPSWESQGIQGGKICL